MSQLFVPTDLFVNLYTSWKFPLTSSSPVFAVNASPISRSLTVASPTAASATFLFAGTATTAVENAIVVASAIAKIFFLMSNSPLDFNLLKFS